MRCHRSRPARPRRPHDVGEQHRRQHPVHFRGAAGAADKLLDLVHDPVAIAEERNVVIARELDQARARDRRSEEPCLLHGGDPVPDRCSTSVGAWISGSTARTSRSRKITASSR